MQAKRTAVSVVVLAALAALAGLLSRDVPPAAYAQQSAPAQQSDAPPVPMMDRSKYSPYPTKTFANRVYFGDTHLHTALSTDAGMFGAGWAPTRRTASRAARL